MSGGSTPPTADGARKLAAIMFTDIVGFSRQMGVDETRMLQRLTVHNQLVRQAVADVRVAARRAQRLVSGSQSNDSNCPGGCDPCIG